MVGPYSVQQFEILLLVNNGNGLKVVPRPRKRTDNDPKVRAGLPTGCQLPPYLSKMTGRRIAETLARNLSSFEASSGALIARRCEQVRALRDSKGGLSEPLWYSGIGVLAFAQDGGRLAHLWSSGDPRYTECETEERLDRARQLSGPTTCERFHNLKSAVCGRCKWWGKIKSPIVLGQRRSGRGGRC